MSEMNKPFLDTIKATNLCTLKEYIYVYPRLLTEFQKLGDDNNEMSFIKEQIEQHSIHIEIQKNTQKNLLDDGYKDKYGTFEDYILIVRSFDIRIISLKAIVKFLKQKKQELKTPSKNKQGKTKEEKEFLSNQITHLKKAEIAEAIKDKYSSYKGKDFKILYEALLKLDLFPKKGKRQVFFRCLQNEGYSINNYQLLEDIHFATGTCKKGGDYEKSDDEIRRDTIINYLETIINTK